MKRLSLLLVSALMLTATTNAQPIDNSTPPMGWMTWNQFGVNINEQIIRETADAMVATGMVDAGYDYIIIDDGWQGGRDNRNNIIPDPQKFPSGMKALADYVHSKGIKLGIYSDAAPLTCAGYTASLGFETQDARTFAQWDIDYLKYDYCGAPDDQLVARARYKAMADALRKSGRAIYFAACEWGAHQPWLWASQIGAGLWRTTYDVRDMWRDVNGKGGLGILDIIRQNLDLYPFAGAGKGWNDMDMLVTGLYGKSGPSADLGGTGCTEEEYRTQISFHALMCSPMIATCDVRTIDDRSLAMLLNSDIIAISQDRLGVQAQPSSKLCLQGEGDWIAVVKPLSDGSVAIGILNAGDSAAECSYNLTMHTGNNKNVVKDVWSGQTTKLGQKWKGSVAPHQTKVLIVSASK